MTQGPLLLSQLSGYHKAVKIAELIVSQNADLLKTLYANTDKPETFESIGQKVWPSSETSSPKKKFVRSVVYIALKEVLDTETFEHIRKIRTDYFGSRLIETIRNNHGQQKVDAIHYQAGKGVRKKHGTKMKKLFKNRAAEKGFFPWYDEEIAFLDGLIQNPDFCYPNGYLDYKKIVPLLNEKFHDRKDVRTPKSVNGFIYKRARSWWSDDEISLLQTLLSSNISNDMDAIVVQLNNAYHGGVPIRTASCIPMIIAKKKAENEKMLALGITKKE